MLQNIISDFQPSAMFPFFAFLKSGLIKVVLPFKMYQNKKCHGPTLTDASFYIHLKSLNVRHCGMVAATALKITPSRSPSMA
jgi:hypothetical protein